MIDTVGKRLAKARTARGLSLDDAAHATKVRPDKLEALERDDYGHFPSVAYAKGFLQIYSRYLGIDAAELLHSMDSSMPISIDDYQYLTNAPGKPSERIGRHETYARQPAFIPLIIGSIVILGGIALIWMFVKSTFDRLPGDLDQLGREKTSAPAQTEPATGATPAPVVEKPAATPAPATPAPITTALIPATTPAPPVTAPAATPLPVAPAIPVATPAAVIRRATTPAPATPAPPPLASDRTFLSPPPTASLPRTVHELVIEPVKKTWVRIRRDDPTAAPVFEDYLYPNAGELKLRGAKFFLEVKDIDAVQIRKNGQPVAITAPSVTIE